MNQEKARAEAAKLFNSNALQYVGNGFFRYTEPLTDNMISRKGIEHCASELMLESLTLLTRNDNEPSYPRKRLGLPGSRVSILQVTEDYVNEQAKKLQTKYQEK